MDQLVQTHQWLLLPHTACHPFDCAIIEVQVKLRYQEEEEEREEEEEERRSRRRRRRSAPLPDMMFSLSFTDGGEDSSGLH